MSPLHMINLFSNKKWIVKNLPSPCHMSSKVSFVNNVTRADNHPDITLVPVTCHEWASDVNWRHINPYPANVENRVSS